MNRNIADLHPLMRPKVEALDAELARRGLPFRLFEGYRSPERQNALKAQHPRVTNARAWQSAHQYGLAVDYVGWVDGKWSWSEDLPWTELKSVAVSLGLRVPIKWDRPHIEHPEFARLRQV